MKQEMLNEIRGEFVIHPPGVRVRTRLGRFVMINNGECGVSRQGKLLCICKEALLDMVISVHGREFYGPM